jgi:lysophospholipase L1-like esterase
MLFCLGMGWVATSQKIDTVAVIGDSYSSPDRYTKAWPAMLDESRDFTVQNVAIGGLGYANGGFGREVDRITGRPDLIILAGSRNDIHRPDLVRAEATDVFNRLRERFPNVRLVVIGPMWDNTEPAPSIRVANSELAAAAKDAGATFIDALPGNWLGDPSLLAGDHMHPNDAGAAALAANISAALSKLGI